MKINIIWQKPVQLTQNKQLLLTQDDIPDEVEERPGVYYFSREHGKTRLPFYIGETLSVRHRLRQHLKNADIRDVLRGQHTEAKIKNGRRYFHFGYLSGNPSKPVAKKRLAITQRMMIRVAIEEGIPMLNLQLAKIPTNEVSFTGDPKGRGEFEKFYEVDAR